jgi:hypothetical protein
VPGHGQTQQNIINAAVGIVLSIETSFKHRMPTVYMNQLLITTILYGHHSLSE